tara:strand:+ start:423 stop:746 length:324 start_codon:yes stop_codon:yes gene_type:complete
MSEYVDTKLINCNRLASVEARTGNNSNPAVFTNPLNETVKLDVGDKVSLERAFINEVGAGNPQTIEFKGVSTGTNIVAHTRILHRAIISMQGHLPLIQIIAWDIIGQ